MKKVWEITGYTLLAVFCLIAFFGVTHYYYIGGDIWLGRNLEKACYGILCLAFAVYFYGIISRFKHLWARIIAGATTSLLFTFIVFLANNFWRYLCINREFNGEYSISYGAIMRGDIVHTFGWGEFRYPMVFIIMFAVCGLMILISHPRIKAIYRGWEEKLCNWVYIKKP